MVAILADEVLALARMVKSWWSFCQTPARSAAEAAELMAATRPTEAPPTAASRANFLTRYMTSLNEKWIFGRWRSYVLSAGV
jgi:hypothetical protein